jgi:hypothetical protein
MSKLPAQYWRFVFPGVVALGMAVFMSGVVTALNTGIDPDFPRRWLKSFAVAYPLAWVAAIIWAPIAMRLTARFVTPPGPPA